MAYFYGAFHYIYRKIFKKICLSTAKFGKGVLLEISVCGGG